MEDVVAQLHLHLELLASLQTARTIPTETVAEEIGERALVDGVAEAALAVESDEHHVHLERKPKGVVRAVVQKRVRRATNLAADFLEHRVVPSRLTPEQAARHRVEGGDGARAGGGG